MVLYHHPLLRQSTPGELYFGGARMALVDIEAGLWGMRRHIETLVGSRLADNLLQQAGVNGGASFAAAMARQLGRKDGPALLRECIASLEGAGYGRFTVEELEWPIGRVLIRAEDTMESWMVRQHCQAPATPACAYTAGSLVGFAGVLGDRRDVVCIEHTCQAQGADACRFELLPAASAEVSRPVVAFDPDPFLSRQPNLVEMLFDRMPMGIVLWDRDMTLRRCNPTYAGFVERYTHTAPGAVVPGANHFEIVPGIESDVLPLLQRALAGETVTREAVRMESGGVVSYWDLFYAPIIENGEVVGVLDVEADATERVMAYQELERRVEERTREGRRRQNVAEGLRGILATLNSDRPLDEILTFIADQARDLLGAGKVSVLLKGRDDDALGRGTAARVLTTAWPVVRPDQMAVPLTIDGEVCGVIALEYPVGREFSPDEIDLAVTLADQAALAVANARLRERTEQAAVAAERSKLARDLHDAVTQTLFSASLIAEVLPRLWERDNAEGRRRLGELRQLTRGALAEMRTLLLELRPSALLEAQLGELMQQLAEAVMGRARIPVGVTACGQAKLPPAVQVAFYRTAQEALQNAVQHGHPTAVAINLSLGPEHADLTVTDDGTGFDPRQAQYQGLQAMRDRAEAIGAELTVESLAGEGTTVRLCWTAPEEEVDLL